MQSQKSRKIAPKEGNTHELICKYRYIPTCMYEHTCIHLYERLCMHTYILREGRRNSRRRRREGGGSFISQSSRTVESGRLWQPGSQAAFESPGSELGTAVVEKLMLEIQSLLLGCGSKAGHRGLVAH